MQSIRLRSPAQALVTDVEHLLTNMGLVESEQEFATVWLGTGSDFKISDMAHALDRGTILARLELALGLEEALLHQAVEVAQTDREHWVANAAYRPVHRLRVRLSIWNLRNREPD